MKQETLEDIAQWVIEFRFTKNEYAKVSDYEMYHTIIEKATKWQQERTYSDMVEYSDYCLMCSAEKTLKIPVSPKEWFEQFKKK